VKRMEGIFCANFCEPRASWPECRKVWHAECYECLGLGKFPIKKIQDEEGNRWYKHRRVERINHGVRGAHASIHFQCEDCWMVNLEGHLPAKGLDDVYLMLICQANLDAMGGQAVEQYMATQPPSTGLRQLSVDPKDAHDPSPRPRSHAFD
jgi:hypothetical protein